ncbi:hypothetical protein SANTM175S_10189 [Streptomyces antimycoticus]
MPNSDLASPAWLSSPSSCRSTTCRPMPPTRSEVCARTRVRTSNSFSSTTVPPTGRRRSWSAPNATFRGPSMYGMRRTVGWPPPGTPAWTNPPASTSPSSTATTGSPRLLRASARGDGGLGCDFVRTDHVQCTARARSITRVPHGRRDVVMNPRDAILPADRSTSVDYPYAWAGMYHRRLADEGLLHFTHGLRTAEDRPWIWRLHREARSFAVLGVHGVFYRRGVSSAHPDRGCAPTRLHSRIRSGHRGNRAGRATPTHYCRRPSAPTARSFPTTWATSRDSNHKWPANSDPCRRRR